MQRTRARGGYFPLSHLQRKVRSWCSKVEVQHDINNYGLYHLADLYSAIRYMQNVTKRCPCACTGWDKFYPKGKSKRPGVKGGLHQHLLKYLLFMCWFTCLGGYLTTDMHGIKLQKQRSLKDHQRLATWVRRLAAVQSF